MPASVPPQVTPRSGLSPGGNRGLDAESGPASTAGGPPRQQGRSGALRARLDRLATAGLSSILLRAFLGVTFTFAGLQKLANPGFLQADSPGSFEEQLRGSILTSPLHHLLDPALHAPEAVALVIACGELAVGIGTLAGLLARVAALGGMVLSLTFFLTVSFNDSPYYYGADIVFFFAWTTLVLGGAGPISLDALLARRAAEARRSAVTAPPDAAGTGREVAEIERRVALRRLLGVGAVGSIAVLAGGLAAGIGRLLAPKTGAGSPAASGAGAGAGADATPEGRSLRPSKIAGPVSAPADAIGTGGSGPPVPEASGSTGAGSSIATTVASAAPGAVQGTPVLTAAQVPVGGAAAFTDPAQQIPAFAVQPKAGEYRAFSAICTHAGCTVAFDEPGETFVCPCHGSIYNAATGAVIQGPATRPLPEIPIELGQDRRLFVDG